MRSQAVGRASVQAKRLACWAGSVMAVMAFLPMCAVAVVAGVSVKEDPLAVQRARAEWVQKKGREVYYTQTFDLSGLPAYRPG